MTTTNEKKLSGADEYFEANAKFFEIGDSNGKKAFFLLGQYTRKVMECQEKQIAEAGGEDRYQKRLTSLVRSNMTYRVFAELNKLLDDIALKCDTKIFYNYSGLPKQYMILADLPTDKKALPVEDSNTAFSLGLCQKF
jgi:hypothetical protein